MTTFTATVLTLYPETFPGVLGASIVGRGLDNGLQGTTGVGQCGIFGPAPPREPTPSAPQFPKPPL